jgi:hypothetical protein
MQPQNTTKQVNSYFCVTKHLAGETPSAAVEPMTEELEDEVESSGSDDDEVPGIIPEGVKFKNLKVLLAVVTRSACVFIDTTEFAGGVLSSAA